MVKLDLSTRSSFMLREGSAVAHMVKPYLATALPLVLDEGIELLRLSAPIGPLASDELGVSAGAPSREFHCNDKTCQRQEERHEERTQWAKLDAGLKPSA